MRYILAILGFITAFIILIVLIVSLRPSTSDQSKTATAVPRLADQANGDTAVRYVSDGPINADENHRAIRILIDGNQRTIDVVQGYQGTVIATEGYKNSPEAYQAFLASLDRAGFTLSRKSKFDSEAGLCPTSGRYVFELYNAPKDAPVQNFRHWGTVCSSTGGTFAGNISTITGLFKDQIPNYRDFINKANGAGNADF